MHLPYSLLFGNFSSTVKLFYILILKIFPADEGKRCSSTSQLNFISGVI